MKIELDLRNRNPDLDFGVELPPGRISALLGPSGSGKSSILRAVAGLLPVDQGRVRVGDETWTDTATGRHLPTPHRRLGMVSQHYALFPHLSTQANIETALLHLPPAQRRERALQGLRLVHLEGLESRYPRELSGGQRQRVALARAIAREPLVLLLDEPFSAVDRSTRKQLYVELLHLQRRIEMTVVLVTHDLDEAAQLAAYLCLLDQGRLLQAGPTRQVLGRPCCEQAARLLDIPNLFDGTVAAPTSGRRLLLRWGPHTLRVASDQIPRGPLRWAIQPADVLMVREDKPWGSHLENPVPVRVSDLVELGADVLVWLQPEGLPEQRLQMRLPLRALQRVPLRRDQALTVCLRSSDIMLLGQGQAGQGRILPAGELAGEA